VLVLHYVNGQPRLRVDNAGGIPTVKLQPRVRETSSGYGISTLNLNYYRMFMKHPQVIARRATQEAPRIIAGPEGKTMYSLGDRVYAYGVTEPGEYLVYRPVKDIIDPETGKFIGQLVTFSGKLATLPVTSTALAERSESDRQALPDNQYYTRRYPLVKVPTETAQALQIREQVAEIRQGDFLLRYNGEENAFNMMPHEPENQVRARVGMPAVASVDMNVIENERILELTQEGHRFFDLLRWGKVVQRFRELEASDPNFKQYNTSPYLRFQENKNEWLPLPVDEVEGNPYIQRNNPGW